MRLGLIWQAWRLKQDIGGSKQWYLSKTIWVNLMTIIASAGVALCGVDIGITDHEIDAIAVGAVAVANIVLRVLTTQPLRTIDSQDGDTAGDGVGHGG